MTRGELLDQALKLLGNANELANSRNWLNNILYEIESVGFWEFLEAETTYQTENNVGSVAFSASKWPAAALTDYSKGMSIYSAEPRRLVQVSKEAFDEMSDGSTGNPRFFALRTDTLYLYPTPVTGTLPLLTVKYLKEITLPTDDSDDMETVTGIKPKYHKFLIDGVVSEGFQFDNDNRYDRQRALFDRHLTVMLKDNEDFVSYKESIYDKKTLIRTTQQPTGVVDRSSVPGGG